MEAKNKINSNYLKVDIPSLHSKIKTLHKNVE